MAEFRWVRTERVIHRELAAYDSDGRDRAGRCRGFWQKGTEVQTELCLEEAEVLEHTRCIGVWPVGTSKVERVVVVADCT